MYDDELHSNCGNVVYSTWNFFTNEILNRESNITNKIATKRTKKEEHKRKPYTHSRAHIQTQQDNTKTWRDEFQERITLYCCTLLPHARMHTHYTHARTRTKEWCHSLIIPFLLVRLISSLVRSKGLCNSLLFYSHFFPFLRCSSWSSFFCRNALWWLLRVIRNSPTVSRAH